MLGIQQLENPFSKLVGLFFRVPGGIFFWDKTGQLEFFDPPDSQIQNGRQTGKNSEPEPPIFFL